MEIRMNARRGVAALSAVGIVVTPLLAFASPAFASDACGTTEPAATEVAPGVCEVQFTEPGAATFTAPSGVAKLSAILVGGGGGFVWASGDYAGGGGAVVYVASVDTAATLDIYVGYGSDGSTDAAGSTTLDSHEAPGGSSGTWDAGVQGDHGGSSGNGNLGWVDQNVAAGGGAGGPAVDQVNGGPGVTASAAANDADMWPVLAGEPAYGAGGNIIALPSVTGVAGSGANSDALAGDDGLVILRWTMASALPATGLNSWGIAVGAAFAAVLFFVATGSLRARNELKFAGNRSRLVNLLRDADERLSRTEK